MNKTKIKYVLILLICGILYFTFAVGSGEEDVVTPTNGTSDSSSSSSSTSSAENSKTTVNVGENWTDGSYSITYLSVNTDFKDYNKYADVKSGYKVIKADFEAENKGSTDFYFSAYSFNCYADGYDCDSFYYVDDAGFSSTLSTGKKAKGSVYFQVPVNAEKITLEYETNIWTGKKVEFIVK